MGAESAALDRARRAYDERRWADAMIEFRAIGGFPALELDDVERLAWAQVRTLAPAGECLDGFERLEAAAGRAGDSTGQARAALEQTRIHSMLGNRTMSSACWRRAFEAIPDRDNSVEAAFGVALAAVGAQIGGDVGAAEHFGTEALERGERVDDATTRSMALLTLAYVAAMRGELDTARSRIDQSMQLALSGDVSPLYAAMVACGVVQMCRIIGDWDAAQEWNDVAERYNERESLCHFPGHCSVFRSEIERQSGNFEEAAASANRALDEAGDWSRSWTGLAHHHIGEAELCRGRLDEAEAAFAVAIEYGRDPQPGQARLQAARGRLPAAVRAIDRYLTDPDVRDRDVKLAVLGEGVAIAIAADDLDRARTWSTELDRMEEMIGAPAVQATAAQARGAVLLADGSPSEAVDVLRDAVRRWRQLGAPHDAARARVVLADALDALDQPDDADVERRVAADTFQRLGAQLDLASLAVDSSNGDPVMSRRTFSFTDIVSSSELLGALGDEAWSRVLTVHDRHLRELLAEHGGTEVKHEGDGLFVAFDAEGDAVEWAVAVQRRLEQQRDEHGFAPHIRIGIHCGEALSYGDDFIGRCVHETARIANAADGDEILVSAGTAQAAGDLPVAERRSLDLKGFEQPHPVVLVDWRP